MPPTPLILSSALPSELLTYIIQHESHPTTLLICSTRAEFLASLIDDIQDSLPPPHPLHAPNQQNSPNTYPTPPPASSLLAAPLYQVAIARHIRMLFIPTVSHLRAYLAVFTPAESKIPPPPSEAVRKDKAQQQPPLLLVYGFLGLHRDTSEWSAQGIGATAAGVVEAASRCGFRAVIVDAPKVGNAWAGSEGEDHQDDDARGVGKEVMFDEEVPLLSTSVMRAGGDFDDAAWTGRKVTLRRVLGRWFRYRGGEWSRDSKMKTP
ncbi:unnamed protein product [Discula destructiva]